jgi:hypothetical protein
MMKKQKLLLGCSPIRVQESSILTLSKSLIKQGSDNRKVRNFKGQHRYTWTTQKHGDKCLCPGRDSKPRHLFSRDLKGKGKAIPVTGREGP